MTNAEKTMMFFKYDINEVTTQTRPLVATCSRCNADVVYSALTYYKKKLARDGEIKCQRCSHKHRKGKSNASQEKTLPTVPLPPEVDIQGTIDTFGYDPTELGPWSRKRLVIHCSITKEEHHVKRCGLNRMKSIAETGHYISIGGYAKLNKTGTTASSKTKERMKTSQARRRELEHSQIGARLYPNDNLNKAVAKWALKSNEDLMLSLKTLKNNLRPKKPGTLRALLKKL